MRPVSREGRAGRPRAVTVLVIVAIVAIVAVALAVLVWPRLQRRAAPAPGAGGSVASIPWAVPGVAFRPLGPAGDATGWRVAYVIINRGETLVLSAAKAGSGLTITSQNGLNGVVTLADTNGNVYQERPEGDLVALPDATGDYEVTAFPPLHPGAVTVLVHHNVQGGGTVRMDVNLARLGTVPLPTRPHQARVSGHVRVSLDRVIRGALLSEVDLSAVGFADAGGAASGSGASEAPVVLTMRGAPGGDLAPQVAGGPVRNGAALTTVGFRTPPHGALVTLVIDDYELPDASADQRVTHGHWSFTFPMP